MSTTAKRIPPAANAARPTGAPASDAAAKAAQAARSARPPRSPAGPAVASPPAAAKVPRLHWPLLWSIVVGALIWWGWNAHLERYISPQRGLGYWLGIVGGSMMLLLLLYSARKRAMWLRWMGGIPAWFQIHMTLGVVGPLLILFHSNFKFGAANSNVALVCMLLVAGSGVVGRYIYTRLHAHLDGHESTLEQLKAVGDKLRAQTNSAALLPGLLEAVDEVERRLIEPPRGSCARFAHLMTGAVRMARARYLVRREIKKAVAAAVRGGSPTLAAYAPRVAAAARLYAYRRLDAGRRKSEFQMYAHLFSLWHVLHIPLFFMLLIAGIVHVVAISVY